MSALPGYDHWLAEPYDEAPAEIELYDDDYEEAFERCVRNDDMLREYVFDTPAGDPIALLQCVFVGLPRDEICSEAADGQRDRYAQAKDEFFDGYRKWLGERLEDVAQVIAQERIAQAEWDRGETEAGL